MCFLFSCYRLACDITQQGYSMISGCHHLQQRKWENQCPGFGAAVAGPATRCRCGSRQPRRRVPSSWSKPRDVRESGRHHCRMQWSESSSCISFQNSGEIKFKYLWWKQTCRIVVHAEDSFSPVHPYLGLNLIALFTSHIFEWCIQKLYDRWLLCIWTITTMFK